MSREYLVWDLGGTKCAAAVVAVNGSSYTVKNTAVALLSHFSSLDEMALELHQAMAVDPSRVDGICIGAAGTYDGCELHLASGYPFKMCFSQVAKSQSWSEFSVVHDYTPVVASTFVIKGNHPALQIVREGSLNPTGRRVALGLGTGLGVKDAIQTDLGQCWYGQNEVGHIGLSRPPAVDSVYLSWYDDLVAFLTSHPVASQRPLTFETVLSGTGFVYLYQYLSGTGDEMTPRQVQHELASNSALKNQVLSLLAFFLGLFVSTVELVFMPSGGIYIGGGVTKKNLELFSAPVVEHFWAGVNSSTAYQSLRERFPIAVMVEDESVYLGGAFYAEQVQSSRVATLLE